MATIDISRPHQLPTDAAVERVRKLVDEFQERNKELVKTVSWDGNGRAATAKGQGFTARFAVGDDKVTVSVDLGLMLRPFKGKVEKQLGRKLDRALCPTGS